MNLATTLTQAAFKWPHKTALVFEGRRWTPGLGIGFVVVADEMQEAVQDEMADMMVQRPNFVGRLPRHRFKGQNDIAQQRRKAVASFKRKGREGKDIGRRVLAAPLGVQGFDCGVVGENQAQLAWTRRLELQKF